MGLRVGIRDILSLSHILSAYDNQNGEVPWDCYYGMVVSQAPGGRNHCVSVSVLHGYVLHIFTLQKRSQFSFVRRIRNVLREWDDVPRVTSQTCSNSDWL